MDLDNLDNVINIEIVIIGCDSGFGHLAAIRFTNLGFHVFATCMDIESKGAKSLVATNPAKVTLLKLNITNEEAIKGASKLISNQLFKSGLKLHALINNAGILDVGYIEWHEAPKVDDYERTLDINLYGAVRMCRMLLPLLRESKGRILNVSSMAARLSLASSSAYAMSKAALAAFTESLAYEMAFFGVKVIGIEPWFYRTGIVQTDALSKLYGQKWAKVSKELLETYDEGFFKSTCLVSDRMLGSSLCVSSNVNQVIDCIEEAVTSLEPQSVYQLMRCDQKLMFKVLFEALPRDLSFAITSGLYRACFWTLRTFKLV